MLRYWLIAALVLAYPLASEPAHACWTQVPLVPDDIKYADVVVVGRIANYRFVRDEEFRRRMLANPALSPEMRKHYEDKDATLMGDYARFDVLVDQVLVGKPPRTISVTRYNSTFGTPKAIDPGLLLVALRKASSAMPPLRGPSATVWPNAEPDSMTVLQAPCSSPFMLPSMGDEARAVRAILDARPR
ncbi:MAG: hypothetical protein ABI810_20820 [Sphingomonas bacterium]